MPRSAQSSPRATGRERTAGDAPATTEPPTLLTLLYTPMLLMAAVAMIVVTALNGAIERGH